MNVKLFVNGSRELEDLTMYMKIVGNLIYLTLTRIDLAFVVGVLSWFMQSPKGSHLATIQRFLRYVRTTLNYGLEFKRKSKCNLFGYCNVDYTGDVNTHCICVFVGI